MKKYVKTIIRVDEDGRMRPQALYFDGEKFEIDRVLDHNPRTYLDHGGLGEVWRVVIRGRTAYLYYEWNRNIDSSSHPGKWYVISNSA